MAKKINLEPIAQSNKFKAIALLNVRELPSDDARVLTTIRPGEIFEVEIINGEFGKLSDGWIKMSGTESV